MKASSSHKRRDEESSDSDKDSRIGLFSGIKSQWRDFENNLRARLHRSLGTMGLEYLMESKVGAIDTRFTIKDIPKSLDDVVSFDTENELGVKVQKKVTEKMCSRRRELAAQVHTGRKRGHSRPRDGVHAAHSSFC
jgi:hypothetical protein